MYYERYRLDAIYYLNVGQHKVWLVLPDHAKALGERLSVSAFQHFLNTCYRWNTHYDQFALHALMLSAPLPFG